jgi:hypothetical protein
MMATRFRAKYPRRHPSTTAEVSAFFLTINV